MKSAYLDWNIYNNIEKLSELDDSERKIYSRIEKLIVEQKVISPYSNAHINDLIRGYNNNPKYIPLHLSTLKRLTNNLCIVQYWGHEKVSWHFRDVNEFFNSAIEENETAFESISEMLNEDETGMLGAAFGIYRKIPVPQNFKEVYKLDPIFSLIYPRTKNEMTMFALCEDILSFSNNAKKDYTLYKSLRSFSNRSLSKLSNQKEVIAQFDESLSKIPSHLIFDKVWELQASKSKTSDNPIYQKVTDTYFKIDFRGYKSDDRSPNMIDDALHVFYAAHCDYFVTIDDKCHYKANETYKSLGISARAYKPSEFLIMLNKTDKRSSI